MTRGSRCSEAEQLHAALTERGRNASCWSTRTRATAWPSAPNQLDAYPKAMAFLARHLAG